MGRPNTPETVYLDSCAFLYVLNGTKGFEPVADLLRIADAGQVTILTSPLILVEVRGAERSAAFDVSRENYVRRLIDNPRLLLVEFDRTVALKARDLTWRYQLKPADAIHLASAVVGGADAFMTFDGDFPCGTNVEGVWVDKPYKHGGPDLFDSN
ncbi:MULTISPECIES: type II toxin-antitoxin system VapC family toxin [unclassified Micromonospora]|uniref:type II toxin-antitoxin system VapC family toxin n=1 Tax=unclassified Micromonospora TaxID=2617518 RepID=UPI002FF212D6